MWGCGVNKRLFSSLLLVILFGGFVLSGFSIFTVQAAKSVAGVIDSDTVWTKAKSPYTFTGPVAVEVGVILTIEAGVTVNLNDYYMEVNGTLIAKGVADGRILFNGGKITFIQASDDWDDETQKGSIIENAGVNCLLSTGSAPIQIINSSFTKGLRVGGDAIVSHNTITSSIGSDWVGRPVYAEVGLSVSGNAYVSDNVIFGYFTTAAITASASPIIQRNVISNNYGYGSEGYHQADISLQYSNALIQNNTINKSAIGLSIDAKSSPTIIYNNIQENTNYNIYSTSQSDLNVTYNWWGTTNTQEIDQKIYDSKYDFHLGTISFNPFLTAPNPEATLNPDAPIPTPNVSPSPSPTPISSPDTTPQPQTLQFETVLGAVIATAVIGVGVGLLIYLIKRK
jgi:hypothetical protein